MVLGRYDEVKRGLERLPGVAAASVGEGAEPGRGQLKIRLAAGHDAREVSRAVSELLRHRFGIAIHPSDIKPLPHVEIDEPLLPAVVANGHRPERAAIRDLLVSVDGLEVTAVAVLDIDGSEITGRAKGAATDDASLRAIARATLDAVDHLVPGRAKTDLELVAIDGLGDARRATVTVVYLTPRGEERLAGVALVRDDDDLNGAVVRATLDAVNRRVEELLGGGARSQLDQSAG